MEEQILRMLRDEHSIRPGFGMAECAKDITLMIMEFVYWTHSRKCPYFVFDKEIVAASNESFISIEELFEYWYNNIFIQ